jgi:hypothetical protein
MTLYQHVPHPHIARRNQHPPVHRSDVHPPGFNGRLAVLLTKSVGTMVCAYIFAVLAILGFPGLNVSLSSVSYSSSGVTGQQYVQWVSQTFIQLVMLSIIMVGQAILGAAADKRSDQTYQDAEAILHECIELQKHLQAQDAALEAMLDKLHAAVPKGAAPEAAS